MGEPVTELEFLSRSKHRIALLRALCEPCDRGTLRDRTGVSKPTLSRVLRDFEDRAWVTRTDARYRLTVPGTLVYEGVDAAVRAIETAAKLAPLSAWLPDERPGFDPAHLHDATVLTTSPADTFEVHRRLATLLYEADRVRELTGTVASSGIDVHRRAVEDHDQTLEVVLTANALRTIESNSEMARQADAVLAADGVSAFRYDDAAPYFLALADERALVGVLDDSGGMRGLVVSEHPKVVDWATTMLDEYRAAAEEIRSIGTGR